MKSAQLCAEDETWWTRSIHHLVSLSSPRGARVPGVSSTSARSRVNTPKKNFNACHNARPRFDSISFFFNSACISDHDRVTLAGRRFDPTFKLDSIELDKVALPFLWAMQECEFDSFFELCVYFRVSTALVCIDVVNVGCHIDGLGYYSNRMQSTWRGRK